MRKIGRTSVLNRRISDAIVPPVPREREMKEETMEGIREGTRIQREFQLWVQFLKLLTFTIFDFCLSLTQKTLLYIGRKSMKMRQDS